MKFNDYVENLQNYEAGKPVELVVREYGVKEDDVIKLASNENPLGTGKKAVKAIYKMAKHANLYPDDSMFELKGALADKYGVSEKNVIIGAGSDQIIEFLIHAKCNENKGILTAGTTFSMYGIYAKHAKARHFSTASKFHDLKEIKELYESHKDEISVIFLCVPNNPLGECLDAKDVIKFIKSIDDDTLVVIDAAYNEFASFKDKHKHIEPAEIVKLKNAIYLGTFSKVYGLGGLRVGYGVADEKIISALYKLRPPFNVANLSLAAAVAALQDKKFIEKTIKNNFKEMKKYEKFANANGIKFIKSYTNFITFILNESKKSSEISQKLLEKGLIVRDLKGYGLNAIRITVGLPKQNKRIFDELRKLLG